MKCSMVLDCHSPWYNRNGWLGVKHQVTYKASQSTEKHAAASKLVITGF